MNLLRTLATVSSLTMVSRVLGYVRDFFIARVFGAGPATDAFFVAFKLPNLLRRLFAEGAFSQAFVPLLAAHKQQDEPEAKRLIDAVATVLFVVLVATAALGVAAAPILVYITAPGFSLDPEKPFDLTVSLLRITFPYIAFISLVSLSAGILNTWNRFGVPAITPALLNVAFIVATVFFAEYFDPPVLALAWAVFVGGVLQLAFQVPFLLKLGLLPRWRIDWSHPGLRRVLTLMLPAAFGVSVSQVSLVLNQIFASFLITGSISWLYYADRLMELPAGVLGVAVGTILLPSLSRYHSAANTAEYSRLLDWGLRVTVLLAVPSAVALAVLALPLVTMLFQYGRFGAAGARRVQRRPGGNHPGEDSRAGLLCKTEHRDSGKDRRGHPHRHAAHEPRPGRSPASRGPRARHRARSLPERFAVVPDSAKGPGLRAPARLAGLPAQGGHGRGFHGNRALQHDGRARVVAAGRMAEGAGRPW